MWPGSNVSQFDNKTSSINDVKVCKTTYNVNALVPKLELGNQQIH